MNHLEQLTAEWYEVRGYFVRRNVQVGKRVKGGYECELDVVAFCPQRRHLVHVEPSMDANTWATREARYTKKFEAGRKYIPGIFNRSEEHTSELQSLMRISYAVFCLKKKKKKQTKNRSTNITLKK